MVGLFTLRSVVCVVCVCVFLAFMNHKSIHLSEDTSDYKPLSLPPIRLTGFC
jgi:hypothetical protein